MSEDLEQKVGSAVKDTTRLDTLTLEERQRRADDECVKLGFSFGQITDYVKHCIYEGGGPTSRGSIEYHLKLSPALLSACIDTLLQRELIVPVKRPANGERGERTHYAASWSGLLTFTGLKLRYTDLTIPVNLRPDKPKFY